eukprot:SAG31_NODE_1932_length_6879_cov_123.069322_2_plen_77_part_00
MDWRWIGDLVVVPEPHQLRPTVLTTRMAQVAPERQTGASLRHRRGRRNGHGRMPPTHRLERGGRRLELPLVVGFEL